MQCFSVIIISKPHKSKWLFLTMTLWSESHTKHVEKSKWSEECLNCLIHDYNVCLNGHKESGKMKSYYVETQDSRRSDGSWDAWAGSHQPAARFLSNWYSRNVTLSEPLWLVCVLVSWPSIGQIQHGHCWRIYLGNSWDPKYASYRRVLHLYELWDLIENSWMGHDLAQGGFSSQPESCLP